MIAPARIPRNYKANSERGRVGLAVVSCNPVIDCYATDNHIEYRSRQGEWSRRTYSKQWIIQV